PRSLSRASSSYVFLRARAGEICASQTEPQSICLGRTLAVVRGHTEVMSEDVEVVRRLSLSSILHRRYEAMRALQQSPDLTYAFAAAQEGLRLGDDQTRTWLRDLVDAGLLQKDGEGRWVPAPEFAEILGETGPNGVPAYMNNEQ